MFKYSIVVLALFIAEGAQAFTQCTTTQLAGPGAHVAEEGANPVRVGKYVYAGFSQNHAIGVAVSSDWGRTLGAPVIINDGQGPDSGLRLAAAYASVYALWAKRKADGLHSMFVASHDRGVTWDSPIDLGIRRAASLTQLSADGANVHAAYLTNDGNVTARNSSDGGRTFSAPVSIATAEAEIVITSFNQNVYLAWGIKDPKSEVIFAASHDGGHTFNVKNLTTDRPSGANEPIFALDRASGRLSLVWRENIPWQGVYIQSLDGGDSWSAPLIIDAPARQFMVVDDGTHIYASYMKAIKLDGHLDFQVHVAVSSDGGKTFAPGKNLSGPTGIRHFDGDDERPIPWVDIDSGAFRLTGVASDGVRAWNGKYGHIYEPAFLGAGFLAAPAWNSAVWEGPNTTVMYGFCS